MQVTFPTEQGYAGMFVVGTRKSSGRLERIGTLVLKRTYDVNPVSGVLAPAAAPIPVCQKDQPDNLVLNGDFESPFPGPWVSAGTVALVGTAGVGGSNAVSVTGVGAELTQVVTFDAPLGGREFTLSFSAKADPVGPPFVNAQVHQVCLQAGDNTVICAVDPLLTDVMQRFSVTGTWPTAVTATEGQIILPAPMDAARTAFYDQVQLEERAYLTVWNPETILRYEHDLAAYKPEADLIVLGFTSVAAVNGARVDGVSWMARAVPSAVGGAVEKAAFGWQARVGGPRELDLGTAPAVPSNSLRPDFKNAAYNAYLRAAAQSPAQPFVVPSPTAEIRLERDATTAYAFRLRGDTASAAYGYYGAAGPDDAAHWHQQSVPMTLDTIVVEPDIDRCSVVWRGVWDLDDVAEAAYRGLAVTASP